MRFFFNDFETATSVSQSFVTFIITNLESSLYDIGDQIVKAGTFIKEVIFLVNGDCELNGYVEAQYISDEISHAIEAGRYIDTEAKAKEGMLYETRQVRVPVVMLKEGSWFGEYPIIAMIKTKFELRA